MTIHSILHYIKFQPQVAVSEENVVMLMSMGMTKEMAEAGLRNTDNNMERAVDWIFSHPDGEELPPAAAAQSTSFDVKDGDSR